MKTIQYRWIEAFRAVAATGSTVDAAERLGVDQSAVSRHVSSLEGQLGLHLFDRRNRRLTLTSAGDELLVEAEAAGEALRRFQRRADSLSRSTTGHLHVLTSGTPARGLLPKVVKQFRSSYPDVSIRLEVSSREEIERRVEAQQFDLGIIQLPFAYPARCIQDLGRFDGVCIIPKDHPLALKENIRLKELNQETFVGFPPGTVGRQRIDELFRSHDLIYGPEIEATAIALNELVSLGLGIAITDPFTAQAANSDHVVIRRMSPTISYEFAALFPIKRSRADLAEKFCTELAEQLAQFEI